MKYGYMTHKKPIPVLRKERPINLGDPIQSLAIINLYQEMGIPKEDIVPIDRYTAATYDGEELVAILNGSETYEGYAYNMPTMPPSDKIIPVYFSLYMKRELTDEMILNFKKYSPIGCRDYETMRLLEDNGVYGSYLTGCVTITFPRRESTAEQKNVFLIDIPQSLENFLPEAIRDEAIRLTQVVRFKSSSTDNQITDEEALAFERMAQERLDLIRDNARLVVTSRFHIAVPCIAMGIPVILARNSFDTRYEILEKFIPLYTPQIFDKIDWNPQAIDIEEEKRCMKETLFNAVKFAAAKKQMSKMYDSPVKTTKFEWKIYDLIPRLQFPKDEEVRYAVWGVALFSSLLVIQEIEKEYVNAELVAMIDTYQSGEYMGRPIIQPKQIGELPEDVVVLVMAPTAQKPAKELLENTSRRFILVNGTKAELYNF